MNRVVVVAPVPVPGLGKPMTEQGLAAWGVAQGLRAHGYAVTVLVPESVVGWTGSSSADSDFVVEAVDDRRLGSRIARGKAPTILFDPAHVGLLSADTFCVLHIDRAFQSDLGKVDAGKVVSALVRSDLVTVSSPELASYMLGWMLQTNRDVREFQTLLVPHVFGLDAPQPEPESGEPDSGKPDAASDGIAESAKRPSWHEERDARSSVASLVANLP